MHSNIQFTHAISLSNTTTDLLENGADSTIVQWLTPQEWWPSRRQEMQVYRICCNTKLHRQHYRYQHPLNNPFGNNSQLHNWYEMDPNTINTKHSTTEHIYTAIHSTLPTANSGTPPSFLSFPPQGRNMEAQMVCNLQHTYVQIEFNML